jgi:hypothetical protein
MHLAVAESPPRGLLDGSETGDPLPKASLADEL